MNPCRDRLNESFLCLFFGRLALAFYADGAEKRKFLFVWEAVDDLLESGAYAQELQAQRDAIQAEIDESEDKIDALSRQVRDLQTGPDYACARCELLSLCGQCPGWAVLEGGDREQAVDFLCRVAHLRAEAFGWHRHAEGAPGAVERYPISQGDPLQPAVEEN